MVDDPAQARGLPARIRRLRSRAVARFGPKDVERLLADPGIVRNRLKIESAVNNAARVLEVHGGVRELRRVPVGLRRRRAPIVGRWRTLAEIPAETELSSTVSKDLKRRGFRFVGPTSCYAFMQTVGMVDDHTVDCFRYRARRAS